MPTLEETLSHANFPLLMQAGLSGTMTSEWDPTSLLARIGTTIVLMCLLAGSGGVAYNAMSIRHYRQIARVPGKLYDIGGYSMHMYCTGEPGTRRIGEGTYRAVHLQLAFGALHFDIVIGSEPVADAAIQRRTSPHALAVPTFKSSFETFTDWAIHNFPLRPSARPSIAEMGLLQRSRI